MENEMCSAGECDNKRKPGDTLCAECAATRDEAANKDYWKARIELCPKHQTEAGNNTKPIESQASKQNSVIDS